MPSALYTNKPRQVLVNHYISTEYRKHRAKNQVARGFEQLLLHCTFFIAVWDQCPNHFHPPFKTREVGD